ncbi:DUF3085 domain-containing protein [Mesorhizobium sp. CA18]|uniref:DUF3085 domain-containing protein n=1 Tax=unclassified Mesorhizobium TaxID=325217 RepID=UPI001CC94FA5|nr:MULTISPECIES: DUF3085 domain-containing protein [unclassified Mesorhizobium]MBZ9735043.1 DUF3085 domain-containing protein [Mesorhizobium sp. CA9]MBZ9828894.1 DUF3085 domain-containing protein [Mesorhizobium sp. CA18]MBZ9834937.1 DUF3085 domain-containing protein [Mesorhizobium sp. CA2]MBZ9838909.1 DUF3085 domain-containing protein [Mesorhizobium sp. CA3]MBZ9880121.1 DUF3085 domain-containing protein [Mesorhizobium sp. Ca11]
MFTFPIAAVRKAIERGIEDAAANDGFRDPYYGTRPGEGERAGVWLVGDEGVYIMSNGRLAEGARALVIYSEQCHPRGDVDWWDYKRRHFGADDGLEFIEAERLLPLFDRNLRATHLNVELTETEIALSLITR